MGLRNFIWIRCKTKSIIPDFLIIRRDNKSKFGYVVDILEPHNPCFDDDLIKAKGFAKYAKEIPKYAAWN